MAAFLEASWAALGQSARGTPRMQVFVTTRDHRLLARPQHARTVPLLSPVQHLRDGTLAAALAVEPRDHRMSWPFQRGDRPAWASRAFLDGRSPALTIYAIRTSAD